MKIQVRPLTKDEIAQSAIAELTAKGYRVRKVFNGAAYKKRANQVQKGWCDVGGYDRQGRHVECEIKTVNDRFSHEQIERLDDLDRCGGVALIALQMGTQVKVISWKEAKVIYNI
jgi:hypothetical protein